MDVVSIHLNHLAFRIQIPPLVRQLICMDQEQHADHNQIDRNCRSEYDNKYLKKFVQKFLEILFLFVLYVLHFSYPILSFPYLFNTCAITHASI